MNLPPRVEEPPLKVSQLEVTLGGRWDGAAFSGGYQLATELRGVTWTLKNNLTPESTPGGRRQLRQSRLSDRAGTEPEIRPGFPGLPPGPKPERQ